MGRRYVRSVLRVVTWSWRIVAAFVAMVSGTLAHAVAVAWGFALVAWSFVVGVWPVLVGAAAVMWYESQVVAAVVVAGVLAVWFMLRRR